MAGGVSEALRRMEIEATHAWVVWILSLTIPSVSLAATMFLLASEAVFGVSMVLGFVGVLAPLVIGFALAVRVDRAPLWVRLLWASLPWPIVAIQVVVFVVLAVVTLGPPVGA